ncbi:hypothetical protein GTA08_BOTSDO13062 [Botryosphaeria dothidea]|uniref:Uncharacterized protein n=1 Tax=Botryosphaeria dothidea TaxID=55169 RepID=A0A8H4J3B4_9PEZI|nr:hypothetical protein GTA08_BOTSDO13062 [Botryosphaeria dothidea]
MLRVTLPDRLAAVAWQCPHSADRPLFLDGPDVRFSASINSNTPAATLRLRVSVSLKATPRLKTPIYAFVLPNGLRGIERESFVPDHIRNALGPGIVGLRFRMEQPVVMVAPASTSEGPLAPKNKAAGHVLSLLESLAQTIEMTVYLSTRHGHKAALDVLCSSSASAWAATRWPAAPSIADLRSMYQGRGGIVLPADLTVPPRGEQHTDSPPSYDELALSAPSPPRPPPPKRRRVEEEDGRVQQLMTDVLTREKGALRDEIAKELLSDDSFCDRVLETRWERLRELVADEVRAQRAAERRQDAAEAKAAVSRNMQGLEERLLAQIEERLVDFREEVGDDRADDYDRMGDLVDVKLEEQVLNMKDELNDYVTEQIKDVEDRIRNEIDGTIITLSL